MKSVFIETENVTRFNNATKRAVDFQRGRPGMMMITAPTGYGKTVAAQHAHADPNSGGYYLRAWENMSQCAFLQKFSFEVTGTEPRSSAACKRAIIDALEKRPAMVFVDEADRLAIGRIEDLRDIHDETGSPICLIGEPKLYTNTIALRGRIANRIPPEYRITFGPLSVRDLSIFAMQAAGLALNPEAAQIIHERASATFRWAFGLIESLEQIAAAAGAKTIDAELAGQVPDPRKWVEKIK